jgi:hypothetical protein
MMMAQGLSVRRTAKASVKSAVMVVIAGTWLAMWAGGCSKTVDLKTCESSDGRFIATYNLESEGVIGGHCEVLLRPKESKDGVEVLWGDKNVGLVLSWSDASTLVATVDRGEIGGVHFGRNTVNGVATIGPSEWRVSFDQNRAVVKKAK